MPLKRFKLSPEEVIKKAEQGILDDSDIDTIFASLEDAEEIEEQPTAEEEKDRDQNIH